MYQDLRPGTWGIIGLFVGLGRSAIIYLAVNQDDDGVITGSRVIFFLYCPHWRSARDRRPVEGHQGGPSKVIKAAHAALVFAAMLVLAHSRW